MYLSDLKPYNVIDEYLNAVYRFDHLDEQLEEMRAAYEDLYEKYLDEAVVDSRNADLLADAYERVKSLENEKDILPDLRYMYKADLLNALEFLRDGHFLIHEHTPKNGYGMEVGKMITKIGFDDERNLVIEMKTAEPILPVR